MKQTGKRMKQKTGQKREQRRVKKRNMDQQWSGWRRKFYGADEVFERKPRRGLKEG
jgi:hypothetical protein